jgi:hypothetical protein
MEVTTVSLKGWDVLKLALSAGIVTALITQLLTWLRDLHKDNKTNARMASFSALRLAVELEAFSIACADAISDTHLSESSEGHAGCAHTKIPKLSVFPEDIDWRTLDPSISAKVLTIRNEITTAQQKIDFWYEIDFDCVPNACLDQLGLLGYRAWMLAVELRKRHNIPLLDPTQLAWNIEECLRKQSDAAFSKKATEK